MSILSKFFARISSPLSLLLIAAGLAAGVSAIAYFYLQQREETIRAEVTAKTRKQARPKVAVVVPTADVGPNTVLNTAHFVSRPVEEDLVYPDTLLVKDFLSMQGARLARPVLRGRPVRLSDLQPPEVRDVASVVPLGKRAMTIDIDNLNSIAQTLRPNHHVDIFLISKLSKVSNRADDDKGLEQATLFMQDMVVLATGKQFQDVSANPELAGSLVRPGEVEGGRQDGFDSITLLVSPKEAAKLMVGQKMGTFKVVLRVKSDRESLKLKPLLAADLMPSVKSRDADIEFIVGGRGNDKMLSTLPVSASQALTMRTALAQFAAAGYGPRMAAAQAEQAVAVGPLQMSSPANQPIPVVRDKQ